MDYDDSCKQVKGYIKKEKKLELCEKLELFEKSAKEDANEIWKAVLELNEEYSEVVILYYYRGRFIRL